MRRRSIVTLTLIVTLFSIGGGVFAAAPQQEQKNDQKPQLEKPVPNSERVARSITILSDEVQHQLVLLPNYDVFDWLDATVTPDAKVTLKGEVVIPMTKTYAEEAVKKIEGVSSVVDQIEILPLSPNDDKLRLALYRAIYNLNSPLYRYAIRAFPPIHIIVKNGKATLKGVVANDRDRQLAYMAARGVPGLFEVTNQLQVEQPTPPKK